MILKKITLSLLAGALLLGACKKETLTTENGTTTTTPDADPKTATYAPATGFTFSTTKDVKLHISLLANNDEPVAGVLLTASLSGDTTQDTEIFKSLSNKNGVIDGVVTVPAYVNNLVLNPHYTGLISDVQIAIPATNAVSVVIGGKDGLSGDVIIPVPDSAGKITNATKYTVLSTTAADYVYPTGYTVANAYVSNSTYAKSLGRPAYLDATTDVISPSLLSFINASLPDNQALTASHPEYLSNTTYGTINIVKTTDVYVTYVSESAGNMNTLAYYTYNTSNPPTTGAAGTNTAGSINTFTYVFPNASGYGSNGGLKSGDRVKLGNFAAGTSIGFVLIQSGWNSSNYTVNTGNTKFYSNDNVNPETTANQRKHVVTLYDDVHKVFVSGFEDLSRSASATDNDFNDLVIYTTTTVAGAVSTTGYSTIDKGGDTDGDGVQDVQDAYPADATRAYVSYYPSKSGYGTLAFEDMWPQRGDNDMNDLVVNYRYAFVSGADNKVVDLKATYSLAAAGSSYKNGFGVQLPVSASAVKSVTGQKSVSNYISFASNGVEAGQTKAVIIPFDSQDALTGSSTVKLINTQVGSSKVATQTADITINFTTPLDASQLQVSSFNPFLISNLRRGYEVHLPGMQPTSKADTKLMDTGDDATVPSLGRYYVSLDGQPWALNFGVLFSYPVEEANISKVYLHYQDWVNSNGTSYTDWFTNTAAGYRAVSKIYN